MRDESRTPRDLVFKGLDLIADPLSSYVELRLRASWGKNWLSEARQRHDGLFANNGYLNRDVIMLLRTVDRCWTPAFRGALGRTARAHVHELIDIRNRLSHHESFSEDQAERALSTMFLLMKAIGAEDCASKLKKCGQIFCLLVMRHIRKRQSQFPKRPYRHRLRKWSDDVIALKMSG